MVVGGCFAPFTGGRVREIIHQETAGCHSSTNTPLPLSQKQDKIENFCEEYQDFINVTKAHKRFIGFWQVEKKQACSASSDKTSIKPILRALFKSFWGDFVKATISKLIWSILLIFSIWFFVFKILDYIKKRSDNNTFADTHHEMYEYYLCIGFFACMFVLSIGIQQMGIYSTVLGSKVKAALTTEVYKKMIVRDIYGSKADVVALVAKDVEKLAEACLSLQYLWSGIFETLAVLAVTLTLLGFTILPGVALMAIFMPLQYWFGMIVAYRKKNLTSLSSRRTSLMEEIMRSIKLIKIYGWEASFFENLSDIRAEEGRLLESINSIKAAILGLTFCLPPLMCLVIFGTEEATGSIESVAVFTSMSFFNTLRVPFSKLPKSLRDVLDAVSSMERIQDFLLEPDLALSDGADGKDNEGVENNNQGILFRNASFAYGKEGKIVLENVNLTIPQGALMMVAGPVASGKSNLLKSALGDLTIRGGTVLTSSSRAYVPQTPWTALGTVRDNIVFGLPFDEVFYRRVLFACALEPDLKIMPQGDQTWIGERGGNLSGGQKQRIALARAAYSRAKLYVLDSPLSAVDMYTCQHIFNHCIKGLMIKGGGTVVLATHQTELFRLSDHLVIMQEGNLVYNAKYTYEGIKHLFPNFCGEGEEIPNHGHDHHSQDVLEHPDHSVVVTHDAIMPEKPHATLSTKIPEEVVKVVHPPHPPTLEEREGIYTWYIKKIGILRFSVAAWIFLTSQILRVYSDSWVSVWTQRKYEDAGFTSDAFYAGIYSLLVFVFLCMSFLRAYFYFNAGKVGANNIHDTSFSAALSAPMHFFHVTPVGKLLSFFSKDIDVIDDVLVDNALMLQIYGCILLTALGVVVYKMVIFLAIVAGLTVIYIFLVHVFIKTSKPLKKHAGESTSLVVAHTAETLSGLAVVRAFRMQERFLTENLKLQSRSTVITFSLANLSLWLAFRVDLIGALLVLGCCLLAVTDTSMDASTAGLVVSNSFQILLFFSIMSRTMGEVHDNMKSVDEARTMSNLDAEYEDDANETLEPADSWPSKGTIQFENVVMPYLPNTPPTLKGISFEIQEGEKIGVVGRTGAGKSSLIVALYRLADISEGRIHVDNIDCSRVRLNTLRSRMAIIPQEPVMFSGTLRSNLDPFGERSDEELWDVLHKCLLGPTLNTKSNPDGLDAKVEQMGANFSLGTQQLICLARAMLNPSRILLLDEATAALDSDTNAAVQQVLHQHFADRTIFTIAHRLDTIIDSDRILVMNAGVLAEYDAPENLLGDPESIFHELCMNTGRAQFDTLVARASAQAIAKGRTQVQVRPPNQ